MAATAKLNYKKPVVTTGGNKVHIYHVYSDYMNGAWYNEADDRWIPCQWGISGYFFPVENGKPQHTVKLDLVNDDYYPPEEKETA